MVPSAFKEMVKKYLPQRVKDRLAAHSPDF
jgi:hypothetical protein